VQVAVKSIEKYDMERDEWVQIRTQLNYCRALCSVVTFGNRYIYVLGGSIESECIEVLDSFKEYDKIKCDMINLQLCDKYTPWFKEIILPLGIHNFEDDSVMILS